LDWLRECAIAQAREEEVYETNLTDQAEALALGDFIQQYFIDPCFQVPSP